MEDQGKRLILAVVAAMGIFLLWQVIFPTKKEEEPAKGSGAASGQVIQNPIGQPIAAGSGAASGSGSGTASGSGSAATPAPADAAATAAQGPIVHPRNPADEIAVDSAQVHAEFSKWGGNLVSWKLKDERYATTQDHGELVLAEEVGASAFDVNFAASTVTIPPDAQWQGSREGNVVKYVYSDDKLVVTKTYTLYPQDYLIKLDVGIEGKPAPAGQAAPILQQQLAISIYGYQDPKKPVITAGRTKRVWSIACLANGDLDPQEIPSLHDQWGRAGTVNWAGVEHPYMLLAMAPRSAGEETIACSAFPVPQRPGLVQVALVFSPASIKGGDVAFHREVWSYAGPKYVDKLENADEVAGFKTGLRKAVGLGWFSFIARPLLWLLLQFYSLVQNWGLAIILLTLLVKLATLYWTTKSMRSMRAMAALQPKMKAMQEKFKDDRARQQQEMMALYKTHGVNPLAGCLPILLQMPIWLALYKMLSNAGELYNAPFIPGWIDDLTAKDPFYILGIALVILMFVQAKLQPTTGDGMQQKMMMYVLPGVFGVMSLFFPSGLTLYILTNTILTSLHTLYMRKFDKSAKLVIPAAAAATVAASPRPAAAKSAPAKRAEPIDVEGEERVDDDDDDADSDDAADDGDDDGDDTSGKAPAGKPPANRPPQKTANRPRRGQRRRGRN